MYGITLSDNDRRVLIAYLQRNDSCAEWTNPLDSEDALYATVKHLENIGLVKGAYGGGDVVDYRLTDFGQKFVLENPHLESEPDNSRKWEVQEAHNQRTEAHYSLLEEHGRRLESHNKRTLCISVLSLLLAILSLIISVVSTYAH